MPLFGGSGGGGGIVLNPDGTVTIPGWAYPVKLVDKTLPDGRVGPVLVVIWNGQEVPLATAIPELE